MKPAAPAPRRQDWYYCGFLVSSFLASSFFAEKVPVAPSGCTSMSPLNCEGSSTVALNVTVIGSPLNSVLNDHVTFLSSTAPVISRGALSSADLHEPVSFLPSCV